MLLMKALTLQWTSHDFLDHGAFVTYRACLSGFGHSARPQVAAFLKHETLTIFSLTPLRSAGKGLTAHHR